MVEAQATKEPVDVPFKDPEVAQLCLNMVEVIEGMPAELQDRFKALLVLYSEIQEVDVEEEKGVRKLELKYEKLYQDSYQERAKILTGEVDIKQEHIDKYEELKEKVVDDDYEKLEVPICDVKDIQNMPKGVAGFWLRALLAF